MEWKKKQQTVHPPGKFVCIVSVAKKKGVPVKYEKKEAMLPWLIEF